MSNANRHVLLEKPYPPCTIYKGENPDKPGCSIELHDLQPQLLGFTFRPASYPAEEVFSAGDMNLYDDLRHHSWYQRPDLIGSEWWDCQDFITTEICALY